MSKCVIGCKHHKGAVYFDLAKLSRHSPSRVLQWKVACGVDEDFSICSAHFFLKQPARHGDEDHPDWVPWLNMRLGQPDDPQYVKSRMMRYDEIQQSSDMEAGCCVFGCVYRTGGLKAERLFQFPALDISNYTTRVLSEKRLLVWNEVINQANVREHATRTLKICGGHFVSGKVADLFDIGNPDWIPNKHLQRLPHYSDHIVHFRLQNLVQLLKADSSSNKLAKIIPGAVYSEAVQEKKIHVGFKCILCLSNISLKPLTASYRSSVSALFRKDLRVDSDLICSKCSDRIAEFDGFCETIRTIQKNVRAESIKNIIPLQTRPTTSKTAPPPSKIVKNQLYEALPENQLRCAFCKQILPNAAALNNHLFQTHKVKIYCKLCKQSFSPNGFETHRTTCGEQPSTNRNQSVQPAKPTNAVQAVKNTPADPAKATDKKYSCYICSEFFTPKEMTTHILTHKAKFTGGTQNTRAKSPPPRTPIANDGNYEVCKEWRCNRVFHKDDREKHKQQHVEERARIKAHLEEQKARRLRCCETCQMVFKTEAELEEHRKQHEVFPCGICKSKFTTIFGLMKHEKEQHATEMSSKAGQKAKTTLKRSATSAEHDSSELDLD